MTIMTDTQPTQPTQPTQTTQAAVDPADLQKQVDETARKLASLQLQQAENTLDMIMTDDITKVLDKLVAERDSYSNRSTGTAMVVRNALHACIDSLNNLRMTAQSAVQSLEAQAST